MIIPPLIDLFYWMYRNWVKLILVLGLAVWLAVISFPDRKVKVVFCSAGQGDETLIQKGFTQILIDGSRKGRALDCLRKHIPFFDRQIELMIVSHPQTDHFGGLSDVIKKYRVMSFVYNGMRGESQEWEEFSKLVLEEGAEIEAVAAGDEIRAGELRFQILWPPRGPVARHPRPTASFADSVQALDGGPPRASPSGGFAEANNQILGVSSPGELNSGAVVMDFSYGDFNALFTGDIGEEEETEIINNGYNNYNFYKHYQVLKVAHHGSKYSSSLEFLKAIRPALAVIEVGKNSYGHPTAEAMDRLKEVGARVMRTDRDGEVVVETDGERWKVNSKRTN